MFLKSARWGSIAIVLGCTNVAADERGTSAKDLQTIAASVASRIVKDLIRCGLIGEEKDADASRDPNCKQLEIEFRSVLDANQTTENTAVPQSTSRHAPASGSGAPSEATPALGQAGDERHTAGQTSTPDVTDIDARMAPSLQGRDSYAKYSDLSIQATNQNSQVGITVKRTIPSPAAKPGKVAENADIVLKRSLTASFTSPVSKTGSSTTNIATLDGLANAFKFSLGFQSASFLFKDPKPIPGTYAPGYKEFCVEHHQDPDADCDLESQGISGTSLYDELLPFFVGTGHFYGMNATVGYNTATTYNQDSLAKSSISNVPWELGSYYAFYFPISGSAFQAGGSIQHAYKAQDATIRCPGSSGSIVKCVSGAFGRPAMVVKQLAYLEWRRSFDLRLPLLIEVPLAVDMKITHDFKNGDNGVDVPIFLFPNSDSILSGGIRFGWTNTDHLSAGVFVSAPFTIDPK